MTHVVTAACFGCKTKNCMSVCPSDCFHEGEKMLYIDPESCIDCFACEPECPVSAIYHDVDLPEEMHEFVELNREMALTTPLAT